MKALSSGLVKGNNYYIGYMYTMLTANLGTFSTDRLPKYHLVAVV